MLCKCLKAFPGLLSSNDQIKSTLYSSVKKIMFQLDSWNCSIDPYFFLKSLKDVKDAFISEWYSFNLHSQKDVAEVLEILLEELTGPFIVTSAAYGIKSLTSATCQTCDQLNRTHPTYTSSSCAQTFSNFACHSFRNRIFDLVHIVIFAQV